MARFLALYMGTEDAEAQQRWNELPAAEQQQRSQRGMTAWGEWVQRNQAAIVDMGSPLGRTLLASSAGIEPTSNAITAYVVVEADSHEAAARLFENHPHFAILPGTGIEILQCLPMPGA